MYKHGSLLALFLFLRYVHNCREQKQVCGSPHAVWNGNSQRTIPFLLPEMPVRACPHKRLDKKCLRKGEIKERWKKNVFKCNRCGESGGMLSLYGRIYGLDNQTAYEEIKGALGRNEQAPSYQVRKREIAPKEPEIPSAMPAPDYVRHKTYSTFFSMLVLADTHRQNLLKRGFTEQQIEENGYKSTPVFGYKKLTGKLLSAGCIVEGVPGFYQDKDGEWTIHFSNKSSGFLVTVRNIDGLIVGAQIRLDQYIIQRLYFLHYNMNTCSKEYGFIFYST